MTTRHENLDHDGTSLAYENGYRDGLLERNAEIANLQAELREHRAAALAFTETVAAAVRANDNRGRGGQHVSFHGDFCAATPSVLNRLEWWASHLGDP